MLEKLDLTRALPKAEDRRTRERSAEYEEAVQEMFLSGRPSEEAGPA